MPAQNVDKPEGIPSQNWFLLQQFNFYRLAIAFFASILSLLPLESSPVGEPTLNGFAVTALTYLVVSALAIAVTNNRGVNFYHLVQGLTVLDIVLITLLMHTSSGLAGGISLLLLVSIAECSVLLERTRTFALASIATFSVMIEYSWTTLSQSQPGAISFAHGLPKIG